MAEAVTLLEGSDRLVILGAPERERVDVTSVGDWVDWDTDSGTGPGMWSLKFERPQAYYKALETMGDDLDNPLWSDIEVSVDLLHTAPGEPSDGFMRVVEVSVGGPAELMGQDIEVEVTAQQGGPYRLRLMVDDSRFPTKLVVQSWPASLAPAVVLRGSSEPEPDPPDESTFLPEFAAGAAASTRIGNDVDGGPGARQLTGQVGIARASRVMRRSPVRVGERFGQVVLSVPSPDSSNPRYGGVHLDPRSFEDHWDTVAMRHEGQLDRLCGWHGGMWSKLHPDDDERRRRVYWWRWVRRVPPLTPDDRTSGTWLEPVLPRDTLVVVHLNRLPGTPVQTEVVVEHRDVPVEWVDDLTDWWTFTLARISLDP